MVTLKLTAEHFKQTQYYYKEYIGQDDLSNFNGNLEIAENLGWVKFTSLKISGYIFAKAGSGIEAGGGIEAGWSIKAGWGIEAGSGIKAGWGIKAGEGIKAGWGIKAKMIFSSIFEISAEYIQTKYLPFYRKFWSEMPPLKKWKNEILSDECWDYYKTLMTKKEAKKVCSWNGWHWILKAQLEMFFGLKEKYIIENK